MALVSFAEMQDVIAAAFINAGMIEQEARQCARIHTESTLDGVNSHGVNRVARFVDYLSKGWSILLPNQNW
jgi:3-dehydro-L-gulonate 2-dehydrogenase